MIADDDAFSHPLHRDAVVTTLAGNEGSRFLARVDRADATGTLLTMAKATGVFKQGRERRSGRP